MKKHLSVVMVLIVVFAANSALAATLVYAPESIGVTISAGNEKKVPMTVGVTDAKPATYYLYFIDNIANGNLPLSWLAASPGYSFVYGSASDSAALTIRVPAGTPAGEYAGVLLSRAIASHDRALPGTGIRLNVSVPSQCSGAPVVTIISVTPQVLWPPDHSMIQVLATGTVTMPDGCTMVEAGYAIDDEYGVYSGVHALKVDTNGSFVAVLPVEAMRQGQDKDGRHYLVTFYAKNQAGTSTSPGQVIVVPHDQSSKR